MRSLAERIKEYEKVFSRTAVQRMPLMIRVDGRAFHTFTRNCVKPFDKYIMESMVRSATKVAEDMQGFKAAYIQSDEATFCITNYDTINTQGWFGYDINKMISLSAALMSVSFNYHYQQQPSRISGIATFDSRAFNVPIDDVVNAFLWRAKDWERNSIQMYARHFFSHKQLNKKRKADIHEMLHGIGKNWATDLSDRERNGTFIILRDGEYRERTDILPSYQAINDAIGDLFVMKG